MQSCAQCCIVCLDLKGRKALGDKQCGRLERAKWSPHESCLPCPISRASILSNIVFVSGMKSRTEQSIAAWPTTGMASVHWRVVQHSSLLSWGKHGANQDNGRRPHRPLPPWMEGFVRYTQHRHHCQQMLLASRQTADGQPEYYGFQLPWGSCTEMRRWIGYSFQRYRSYPSTLRSEQCQISLQPHQKYYTTQYGELGFS